MRAALLQRRLNKQHLFLIAINQLKLLKVNFVFNGNNKWHSDNNQLPGLRGGSGRRGFTGH